LQAVERSTETTHGVERGIDVVEREEGDDHMRRTRDQPQPRRRDDGQGALAPAHQAREVVARVVLFEAVEPAHDPTVGEHGLHPDHLPPGRPVSQHVHTAGVGGDRPTDGRGVACGEVDAVLPARGAGVRVEVAIVTPACAVVWPVRASTGPIASSRRRSSTTSPCSGTDPPTRPVLPALRDDSRRPRIAAARSPQPRRPTRAEQLPAWRRRSGPSSP
jgi:hypothetical protein